MAKSTSAIFPEGLRGRIGNLIFRKRGNTTVVYEYNKPDKKRKSTIRQKLNQERFKEASEYARKALKDRHLKMQYHIRALEKGKGTAFNIAMSDFLNKPQITEAEIFDNRLQVKAKDDFRVERVEVLVKSPEGESLQEGNAILLPNGYWYFNLEQLGTEVVITAFDLPGNSDQKVIKL